MAHGDELCAFGPFTLDVASGELKKNGRAVKLHPQPARMLSLLVGRAGELVTREEIQEALWPDDTFVDFDLGINSCVRQIRTALGDEADTPRFIETVPRKGYRFIAPLEDDSSDAPEISAKDTPPGQRRRKVLLWAAAAVSCAALWAIWKILSGAGDGARPVRASLDIPPEQLLIVGDTPVHAISPDGAQLVYRAQSNGRMQLYVRELARSEVVPIEGSEGARMPFFSPDGAWLGFFAGGELKKVRLDGSGPPVTRAFRGGHGGSWGPDDTIVFTQDFRLMKVRASGGTPEGLTEVDSERGELAHYWPDVLPNGKAVLFTIVTGHDYDESDVVALNFDTEERHYLVKASFARYAPTGHLIYARENTLYAVAFDPDRLEVRGTGVPVQTGVHVVSDGPGSAHFAFARNGTLVYLEPPRPERHLFLVDLEGTEERLAAPPLDYWTARFSPDGSRLALNADVPGASLDVHVYELEHERMGLVASAFEDATGKTFEPSRGVAWSPDGRRLAVNATAPGERRTLFTLAADGSGDVERVTKGEGAPYPDLWTKEGKLIFTDGSRVPGLGAGLFEVDLESGDVTELVNAPSGQVHPALSPDGRWLAYTSTESGRPDVYLTSYPGMEGRHQVSEGGAAPTWSPDGRRLYYRQRSRVMAVDLAFEPELVIGTPELVFDGPYRYSRANTRAYDISPDGQRFVMIEAPEEGRTKFQLVLHWLDEVERLVPP